MDNLTNLIHRLSHDPFNYLLNFDVAKKYLELGQTASAVSFFLRCAEYGANEQKAKEYVYSSLLAIAKCFDDQTGREHSVTNTLLQALAFDDSRPEAYFLLAQFHDKATNWQECYTYAKMGLGWSMEEEPLPIEVGYYGNYCLEFEIAVSAYWVGRKDESLQLFTKLDKMELHPSYRQAVKDNLEKLNALL